jgi:hypothetical protein
MAQSRVNIRVSSDSSDDGRFPSENEDYDTDRIRSRARASAPNFPSDNHDYDTDAIVRCNKVSD